jgi:hypothetical protein
VSFLLGQKFKYITIDELEPETKVKLDLYLLEKITKEAFEERRKIEEQNNKIIAKGAEAQRYFETNYLNPTERINELKIQYTLQIIGLKRNLSSLNPPLVDAEVEYWLMKKDKENTKYTTFQNILSFVGIIESPVVRANRILKERQALPQTQIIPATTQVVNVVPVRDVAAPPVPLQRAFTEYHDASSGESDIESTDTNVSITAESTGSSGRTTPPSENEENSDSDIDL